MVEHRDRDRVITETETEDDERAVTTIVASNSVASSFLDQHGMDEALKHVQGSFPNQTLTAVQKDAWLDILCQLKKGELREVLAIRARRYRPDAYEFLEEVLANRQAKIPVDQRYNTPDTVALRKLAKTPYETFDPEELPAIQKAREALKRAAKPKETDA